MLSAFFTLLTIFIEDYTEIKGFGLVLAVISVVLWLVAGVSAVDLTSTTMSFNGTITEEYIIHYPLSWVISLVYMLISIFPFIMILKSIPDSWKKVKEE